jgi:predicted acyl esterase
MDAVPPVRLEVREDRETVHAVREEAEWPLARTEWTELFLAPGGGLGPKPAYEGTAAFETGDVAGVAFTHRFERETELSGPMSVRLRVELRGADDMNVFVAVDKFRDGRRVPFEGSYGFGMDHVAFGWQKLSLRDGDFPRPLAPGEIAEADVELPPSATLFRAGEELRVTVRGRWPWRRNPFTGALPAAYEPSPEATCILRLGGPEGARLLAPVIP